MRTCFMLIGLLLVLAAPAYAQNAQIVGTVKDATGGVVPGATVTAKNGDTGFTRSAVTEANGEYRLPSLPPRSMRCHARREIARRGRPGVDSLQYHTIPSAQIGVHRLRR